MSLTLLKSLTKHWPWRDGVPHCSLQVLIFPSTYPRQDLVTQQTHLGSPDRNTIHLSRAGAAVNTTAFGDLHRHRNQPWTCSFSVSSKISGQFLRQISVIYQASYKYFSKIWEGRGKVCSCLCIQIGSPCVQTPNQFYRNVPEVLPCNTKLHITCPSTTLYKETMHIFTLCLIPWHLLWSFSLSSFSRRQAYRVHPFPVFSWWRLWKYFPIFIQLLLLIYHLPRIRLNSSKLPTFLPLFLCFIWISITCT